MMQTAPVARDNTRAALGQQNIINAEVKSSCVAEPPTLEIVYTAIGTKPTPNQANAISNKKSYNFVRDISDGVLESQRSHNIRESLPSENQLSSKMNKKQFSPKFVKLSPPQMIKQQRPYQNIPSKETLKSLRKNVLTNSRQNALHRHFSVNRTNLNADDSSHSETRENHCATEMQEQPTFPSFTHKQAPP
jgi:hypothetical protein